MTHRSWTAVLAVLVGLSALAQLLAAGSAWVAALAGLVLVLGGTALASLLSHSPAELLALPQWLRPTAREGEEGLGRFLEAADCYRRGNVRGAELLVPRIPSPLLRRGTQLVLDGFHRDQVSLALQWQVAQERDRLRRPVELLRAMSGYAPAFGMLGTLLGLIQMLFSLGSGDLDSLGGAMGFAMLTTVYGLLLSNLVLKPVAMKLDQRGRVRLARWGGHLQAVLMLFDRQHSALIREMVDASARAAGPSAAPSASLRLVASR